MFSSSADSAVSRYCELGLHALHAGSFVVLLELQPAFAGGVGEGLDPAVVLGVSAVEDDASRRPSLARRAISAPSAAAFSVLVLPSSSSEGPWCWSRCHRRSALRVVDDLGVDVLGERMNGEARGRTRSRRRPSPHGALRRRNCACLLDVGRLHLADQLPKLLPALRRTCSPS